MSAPKVRPIAETFAGLAAVPPRSDIEENQSAAGSRILIFDHREKKHGSARKLILPFHKGYRVWFKAHLRNLTGMCVLTCVHSGEMEPKGLR